MRAFDFDSLADGEVLPALNTWAARERTDSVHVIGLIAVADARKLYLPAGYPSMAAYCVGELRFSEDAAYKRITVARKAREYPAIFPALEDGRLHMTAVLVLAPYLTPARAEELLAGATHKTKSQIEQMVAALFPGSEVLPLVLALPGSAGSLAPERVEAHNVSSANGLVPGELAPERVETPARRASSAPIAADRYEWRLTVGRSAQEKLEHARNLLSHQLPSGDMAEVLERGLNALIARLEKTKFAATDRPRTNLQRANGKRTIPAAVQRAVWKRDQGRCTFVGDTGHRCGARARVEFDHFDPVARGGPATVDNVRLLCRAHNQHEAERVLGNGFMSKKREESRGRAACNNGPEGRQIADENDRSEAEAAATQDVIACLQTLGFKADQVRRGASVSATLVGASLEERVRLALSCFRPRAYRHTPAPSSPGVGH